MRQSEETVKTKWAAPVASWFKAACLKAAEGWEPAVPTSVRYGYRDLGRQWAAQIANEESACEAIDELITHGESAEVVLRWLDVNRHPDLGLDVCFVIRPPRTDFPPGAWAEFVLIWLSTSLTEAQVIVVGRRDRPQPVGPT